MIRDQGAWMADKRSQIASRRADIGEVPEPVGAMKLELPSQCLLPDAQAMSRVLLDALKTGESIEVDGHAVTRIGTAALQLLWLARRDVTEQAHEWQWTATSEPLRRAARQLFMTDALGLPRDEPLLHPTT